MSTHDVSRAVAVALSRRKFLGGTATTTLSAAAVGLLAGSGGLFPRRAWAATTSEQDVRSQQPPRSPRSTRQSRPTNRCPRAGLLKKDCCSPGGAVPGQHKEHVDLSLPTFRKLGGAPAGAKAAYQPGREVKTQEDVLRFAAGLGRRGERSAPTSARFPSWAAETSRRRRRASRRRGDALGRAPLRPR